MRLHHFALAPNPRKVRVYLAEKGIEVPLVDVNLPAGEQREPAFLARNPMGSLPVLELDDGTHLTESLAIIEYFEELHPDPPMLGDSPLERARIRELERMTEFSFLARVARIFFNTSPLFSHTTQIPEVAEEARAGLPLAWEILDVRVGSGPFAAGSRPTIADCTLYAAFEHAKLAGAAVPDEYRNLRSWYERFSQRPSAKA
jgi:glutathione S-transferase